MVYFENGRDYEIVQTLTLRFNTKHTNRNIVFKLISQR